MPQLSDITDLNEVTKEVANFARDAAYVVVGLGVLGFQRAQVQRVELQNRLNKGFNFTPEKGLSDVRNVVNRQVRTIDEIVEGAVKFIESSLEPLEEQLPGATKELAKKAHEQAREVRGRIRSLVVPAA
jgi:hypothetical protein